MLDFMKRYSGFFLLIIGVVGLVILNVVEVNAESKSNSVNTILSTVISKTEVIEDTFFVDIKGEVLYPSIYQVNSLMRIDDVIKMAGGLTSNADITDINLARVVYDQMVIYIPAKEVQTINYEIKEVVVDIKGAVRYPGVYKVPATYRLYDAIMRAGGMTALADTTELNLSMLVTDQMVLVVPEKAKETNNDSMANKIYVEVTGEVNKTGLYYVDSNLLVRDVINLAGGVKSSADLSNINLSQGIVSQMIIHVPAKNSEVNPTKPDENNPQDIIKKININTATIDELDSLPGIGYIIAQRIIDYRAENGPFESIEDIVRVSGIKESVYAQIKDHICI